MRIDIIAVIPEILEAPFEYSIVGRAQKNGVVTIVVHDLKKYGVGKWNRVDDYPYGGGAGMVIMCEPVFALVDELKGQRTYDEIIYLCPDGEKFNQPIANELSLQQNLLLICGHYKGIDQRIRDELVTREISIGDYVLSGGETAAAVVVDAIVRILPDGIGDGESALTDSFQDGLLSPPEYTRPQNFKGLEVPEVLLSGHAEKIEQWRHDQAYRKTKERRPDLLEDAE